MQRSKLILTREELVAEHGVATGGHQAEADAGVRMLQDGGNAVDAAVAAAFTAFVVEPSSTGLGGYDHIAIYMAERQEFVSIDAYLRAPGKIRPEVYQPDLSKPFMYYGHPETIGRVAQRGHLAAGVPGAVSGLCTAHEMFGKLPLAHVLQPAIEAAEAGLPVTMEMVGFIAGSLDEIRSLPHTADLLLRNGNPPPVDRDGSTSKLDMSDMAKTFRLIAEHGPKGFYTGPVAEAIEKEVTGNGGFITAADLEAYRPKVLRESPGRYRDYDYITANDHLGYEIMNILDQFDVASYGQGSAEDYHLMGEALGHAFIDCKTHYGDPDYENSPANGLVSRTFASERVKGINDKTAAPRPVTAGDPWPFEKDAEPPEVISNMPTIGKVEGTTQVATVDSEGNMVTIITSLSSGFGCQVLVPGTGVFLNNGMQNFDPRPEHPNRIRGGKMPIFAAPSVVATRNGRAVFGACGSGGYRIATGVLSAMVNALDHGMSAQEAADAPRVHCDGDVLYVDAQVTEEVRGKLESMGHEVVVQDTQRSPSWGTFGRINVVRVDEKTGLIHTGLNPAWSTAAAGY